MSDVVPGKRASDAERDNVVELLRRAYAEGRLSADELETRVQRAVQARTRDELRALRSDLPYRPPPRGVRRFHRAALRMHAAGYVGVNAATISAWAATGADPFVWPAIVLAPTSVLLAAHWRRVRRIVRRPER